MTSLSAPILHHARATPDREAIVFRGVRTTYAELGRRIQACAGLLTDAGVASGDVVALLMKNSSAFIELSLAASHIGAVILPINYRLAAEEVGYIVGHSKAKLVFVDSELLASAPESVVAVVVDEAAQGDASLLFQGEAVETRPHHGAANSLFRLMYTSGTTDRPKGVMHSCGNFFWKCLDHISVLGLSAHDRLLVVGPLYHVGAYDLPGVALLILGGSLCILREFDELHVLSTIAAEKISCGWMAPVMLSRILSLPNRADFDLSSFRWLIGGGERTPEERIVEFTQLFRHGRYIDAYGLTETCAGDTFMDPGMELSKIGSTGRAVPNVEIEIRDANGQELPAGTHGEICIRGPKVTAGYWLDPIKTSASFFPGGWFRSGDIGFLDEDGYLFLTDRLKDMILSGGENIASQEVERAIYRLPQVAEVAAIGLPDPDWGERVAAVVVLRPGTRLAEDELKAHCRSLLAGFKVPRQLILRDALPRNPSGKVLKRVLREELVGTAR